MKEINCRQCGRELTEDSENCPECGTPLTEAQRQQLRSQTPEAPRERIYIYGRRKRRLSPEVRAVLIIILIAAILLLMCRVTHGIPYLYENVAQRSAVMSQYEYRVVRMPAQGTVSPLNERIGAMVAEGWEPVLMSGDTTVNVMMRRALPGPADLKAAEAAAIAEPVGAQSSS